MSIWKSPVFYLGILLLLVVGAALTAPFVINWNSYRDHLEAYGRKLTGRDVAINGPISVRLFPWPRLSAEDVSVGNPSKFSGPPMINARNMTVELALAGLFSGEIRVETINIDHPVINIARLSDGQGNWIFKPDAAISKSRLLDQVKLDQIKINDGVLHFQDDSHHFSNTVTALNADISAAALEGPWRVRATGNQNETPIDFTFSSVAWKGGEPLRFGARIAPQDGALPALALDGAQEGDLFKGKMRIEPVVSADGRSSLDGRFKALQMQADVVASFDNITLDKIHIVPADSKDSTTLIEGSAVFVLKDGFKAMVNLNSPRIDLDKLAGAQSLRVWRAGGIMQMLNNLMISVPQKFDLTGNFEIVALSMAGETLENVVLKTSAEPNAIRVQDFAANLPGRSRMKFSGLIFPGAKAAELGGTMAFESNDARAFASWLWPEGKAGLTKAWTGNRGRLKAQSDVSWSGKSFGLQNMEYELDGAKGSGDLTVGLNDLTALNLRLNAAVIDLDNYISASTSLASEILPLLQNSNGIEKHLVFQAGKLHLNGVGAQDVAVDYASNASGFDIKKFDIGSIEGGKVQAQGQVLQGPDGPSGDVKISIQAANPRGLLQLLGITQKNGEPKWTSILGQTDLQGMVRVRPGAMEPLVTYDVAGASGPLQISASGDVKDVAKGTEANLGLSSEISSAVSADIIRLFGLQPQGKGEGSGKLTLTASGSVGMGFKTVVSVEALGGKFHYDGRYKPDLKLPLLKGTVLAKVTDGQNIARVFGLPIENALVGPMEFTSPVITQDGQIRLTDIVAQMGGQKWVGDITLSGDGEVGADLAMGSLDVRALLASAFMNWQGKAPQMDDAFADPSAYPESVDMWLRPDFLQTGLGPQLKEAVIGLSLNRAGRSLTIASAGADGESFKLDLSVKPRDARFTLAGSLQMAVDLEQNLKLQNGAAVAQGKALIEGVFNGEGRSPAAVFSNLNGNGTMALQHAKITQISPQNFFAQLPTIKDASALRKAFDGLLKSPGFDVAAVSQQISISTGVVNTQPIAAGIPDADIQITPIFELSSGTITMDVTITPRQNPELPAMRVTYSGAPLALALRSDTSAIAAKLGYAIIAKDIAELDRVQKEQAKLMSEEAAQRKADEEKFAAFQAQRAELRLRQRELKVFAAQRVIDAAREKATWTKILSDAAALTKTEIPKFLRQLPLH